MSVASDKVPKYIVAEHDDDQQETTEWLDALDGVISSVGTGRAHYLVETQIEFARMYGEHLPFSANTPYITTIPVENQAPIPGDQDVEHRIGKTIHPHPTLGASIGMAAELYEGVCSDLLPQRKKYDQGAHCALSQIFKE
jgi:hypothetical protein